MNIEIDEEKAKEIINCLKSDIQQIMGEWGVGETKIEDTEEYKLAKYLEDKIKED